jgi:hypothetical protein
VIQGAVREGEQGGVLEGEEGQAGHQGVGQGEGWAASRLGEFVEGTPGQADQGVEVEVTMQTWQSRSAHGRGPGSPPVMKHSSCAGLRNQLSAN